jgi:hypothetical protein
MSYLYLYGVVGFTWRHFTVIRFVSIRAKFWHLHRRGSNGTLVEAKICTKVSFVRILASTSVPFRPTKVKMPNLALIETKRITVCTKHLQSVSRAGIL